MAKEGIDRCPIGLAKIRQRLLGRLGGLPISGEVNHAPVRGSKGSPSLLQSTGNCFRGSIMSEGRCVYNPVLTRYENVTLVASWSIKPGSTGEDAKFVLTGAQAKKEQQKSNETGITRQSSALLRRWLWVRVPPNPTLSRPRRRRNDGIRVSGNIAESYRSDRIRVFDRLLAQPTIAWAARNESARFRKTDYRNFISGRHGRTPCGPHGRMCMPDALR